MGELDRRIAIVFFDEDTGSQIEFQPTNAEEFIEFVFNSDSSMATSLFSDSPDQVSENIISTHIDLTQFTVNQVLIYVKNSLLNDPDISDNVKSKYLMLKDFLTVSIVTGFELSVAMSDSLFDAASSSAN